MAQQSYSLCYPLPTHMPNFLRVDSSLLQMNIRQKLITLFDVTAEI